MGYTIFPYSFWTGYFSPTDLKQFGETSPCNVNEATNGLGNIYGFLTFFQIFSIAFFIRGILSFIMGVEYKTVAEGALKNVNKISEENARTVALGSAMALSSAADRGTLMNIIIILFGLIFFVFSTWAQGDLIRVFSEICRQNFKQKNSCGVDVLAGEANFDVSSFYISWVILIIFALLFLLNSLGNASGQYENLKSEIGENAMGTVGTDLFQGAQRFYISNLWSWLGGGGILNNLLRFVVLLAYTIFIYFAPSAVMKMSRYSVIEKITCSGKVQSSISKVGVGTSQVLFKKPSELDSITPPICGSSVAPDSLKSWITTNKDFWVLCMDNCGIPRYFMSLEKIGNAMMNLPGLLVNEGYELVPGGKETDANRYYQRKNKKSTVRSHAPPFFKTVGEGGRNALELRTNDIIYLNFSDSSGNDLKVNLINYTHAGNLINVKDGKINYTYEGDEKSDNLTIIEGDKNKDYYSGNFDEDNLEKLDDSLNGTGFKLGENLEEMLSNGFYYEIDSLSENGVKLKKNIYVEIEEENIKTDDKIDETKYDKEYEDKYFVLLKIKKDDTNKIFEYDKDASRIELDSNLVISNIEVQATQVIETLQKQFSVEFKKENYKDKKLIEFFDDFDEQLKQAPCDIKSGTANTVNGFYNGKMKADAFKAAWIDRFKSSDTFDKFEAKGKIPFSPLKIQYADSRDMYQLKK